MAATLLAAGLPLTLAATPAHAADVICGGRVPTIVGTDGNDHLVGTNGPDVIIGRAGDDVIDGRGGDDVICGGAGADVLRGGPGDDRLYGDRVGVRRGDLLVGGAGDDRLDLSATASPKDSRLRPPSIFGFASASRGVHVDLRAGTATGQGRDTLVLPALARRSTFLPDIGVIGSPYDDVIAGSAGPDKMSGGPGDDVVEGRAGADVLRGEAPRNEVALAASPDDDVVRGGTGRDEIWSFAGADELDGNGQNDGILVLGDGAVTVHGGGGADGIQATLARATSSYDGGSGRDRLGLRSVAGEGSSPVASLALDETAGTSTSVYRDGTSYAGQITGFEAYRLAVRAPVTFIGDDRSTLLYSSYGPLDASMGGGDDKVHGSPYDDRLDGGDGTDRVWPSAGTNTCTDFEQGRCS